MRLTLGELRTWIREEVERNMRWSAGFFVGGGISGSDKGIVPPPPGLGDEEEQDIDNSDYEEQQKNQPAVRVNDRAGG